MFYSLLPVSLSLILYGTMGLFILAGALRGHRKGFKADLFWLITNILFWVSFVIIVETYITREFIENPQFLTLAQSFGLETGTSTNLVEYGADYASNQFSIDAAVITQDALLDIVFAIVQIVVKIVVLPVYAIVYHLVVALLYLIIFRRFFKPKKIKIEKYSAKLDRKKVDSARKAELIEKAEKRNRKSKVSKNIGWITGLVRGGLSALVFLSIFNSFINLLPTLESLNSNYSAEEGGSSTNTEVSRMNLYDYISLQFGDVVDIKEICDYINEYRNGTLAHITDVKVGEKTLDAFVVDLLLEGKSNDFSLSIREEIMQVVKIADYACELTNGFDLNNIDYLALNANQITCLENIIIILSDDKLVKNLGEAALSVALSLDAVKDMIPEGIEIPEINIDLSQELKSIAGMVKDAYSLIGEDKKIDYNNLDPDVVESLISKISELQTVQVVCQVGSAFAVDQFFAEKDEAGNVTNQAKLDSMKESLADVVWKEDITDLGSLYRKYLDLGIAGLQESCKDEEGKLNTIKLVTSLKNDKLNAIIETIFETDFLTAIMPDVMEIVRNKYIPEDYKDMISPNITTAAGWEAELKSLLTIVKDLTQDGTRPLEAMDKLDFSILKDLSTRTIVSSELLSYAMIGILIDASNGEGLVGEALGDYIAMPTELKAAADSTTHKYNAKWYSTSSEEGELEVMLDALKNIASSVSSLDNIMGSITDVLDAIDPNDFEKSEVLHFTVSKLLLENAGDFLKIPTTSFMSDAELGVDAGASVIKASEITDIIDILTDENIFNIKSLMAYKNKNDTEAPALKYEEYNELSEEEKANYTAEFSTNLDIGSVSGILTNKTLYDPDSTEAIEIKDANLNKLFGSAILRTTISYFINEYAGDFITMPSTEGRYEMVNVYSKDSTGDSIKALSLDECKNLVKAIDLLDINFETIADDPLSLMDTFKNNNKAEKIFGKEINSTANPDYSETIHFTVSTLLLDKAGDFLKVPTNSFMDAAAFDDTTLNIIKSEEIVEILEILSDENIFNINSLMKYNNKNDTSAPSLTYDEYKLLTEEEQANYSSEFDTNLDIGGVTGILTSKTLYDPDSTEEVGIKDANLNKLFGSAILRTTISYFINEYAGDFITMPSTEGRYEMVNVYAAEGNETIKALSLDECKNLVKAIDLLDIDFESISDNPLSLMDTFKNNNKAEKIFGKEINSTTNPDYSETIHFTVSEILLDKAGDFLKVPTTSFMDASAFDDTTLNIIKSEEIVKLLEILSDENVFNLNTLMSYKNKNDTEAPVLKYEQYKLLNEEAKANYTSEFDTNLDIGGITGILTSKTLYDPDSTEEVEIKDANLNKLFGSAILRTTISFFINEYASDFVVMPSSTGSFEMINVYAAEGNESIKVLSISESKNLVKTIDILDLDFEALSDDPLAIVDSFKDQEGHYKNTNTAKIFAATIDSNPNPDYSETFHATLSKFVFDFASDNAGNDFTVKIPDEAKDAEYLVFDEIDAFLKGMCALDVNSLVSGGNISIVSLIYDNQNISDAFDSKIIRFSITSYLENSNATKDFLSIPTTGSSIEKLNYNATQVNVLTKAELTNIFGGFKTLIEEQYIYLNPTVKVEDRKPNTLSDNALMNPSAKAIKNASDDMFKSIVILKLVSSKIDDMAGSSGSLSIIVPADVYDSTEGIIAATELTSLIGGLCEITGGGSISDMSIDSDNLINDLGQKDDAMVSTIFASSILRASMTNSVKGISALKIPHDVTVIEENELDKAGNSIDILKTEEIVKLVKLFNQIGSGTGGLNALDVSTLSIDKLISMMNDLAEDDDTGSKISGIFRATLADKLLELNSTSAIYVGIEGNFVNAENQSLIEYNNSYEAPTKANYANINYIKYTEIDKMFKSIKVLLGTSSNTSLTSLSGDSFTSNTGNMLSLGETEIATLFASDIMVSTMSVIISGLFKEPGTLKYLSEDKVDEPFHYTQYNLPREELENFYRAIQIVMPAGATNIDNMQLDFESIIVKLADPDKVSKLTASKLLSYNIKNYLISLNAASNGFNNMLALANCNCSEHAGCVHNYNRYYYAVNADGTTANNDLVGLLNSFALIYGNPEFVKAFKDTQNADMSVLTSKAFIDTICGNGSSNVIVDSLPNMIEQFKSRITTLVNAINTAIDIANSNPISSPNIAKLNLSFYIPDKFYETTKFPDYATWQSYWYGDLANSTTGYQEGQLYKFFNVITVASSISIYNLTPLTDAMNACELTVLS